MHQVGNQPRLYYDARSTSHQESNFRREYVTGSNTTYSGPIENCPILLYDINNIYSLSKVFLNRFPFLDFLAFEDGTNIFFPKRR